MACNGVNGTEMAQKGTEMVQNGAGMVNNGNNGQVPDDKQNGCSELKAMESGGETDRTGINKEQNGIEEGRNHQNMDNFQANKHQNGVNDDTQKDNGPQSANQNQTPKDRQKPKRELNPQKVIYKGNEKDGPSPSINLGVWGKIPIHTLSDMYLDTADGCMLTVSEAKMSRSIGGWVYAGAACLAKYLESLCLTDPQPEGGSLQGKRVIELGAGTGVVGLLAGYYGADTIITDMDNIVPLIDYNIQQNKDNMKGNVAAKGLVWGEDASELCDKPIDYLILANCVYYEPSLEHLATTMTQLASANTEILVCYEERTQGIKALIGRWHKLIEDDFDIEYLPKSCICEEFYEDFVRLLRMKKKG